MSLRVAVQMDPLEHVNPAGDSSFMMIEEAQARGHSVVVYGVPDLVYDSGVVRAQAPGFGASERFAVSPGHEAEGLFHMPSGQSGNPVSPYYLAGHRDWEDGRATPFLPGPAKWRMRLVP